MQIISISGKIGSGKDTVAKLIIDKSFISNWKVKKWATKVKEIASLLTGIPVEKFESQEFKRSYLSDEWSKTKTINGQLVKEPMTVRDLLQTIGTDAIRDVLHEDAWVNALMSEYKTKNDNYWIITDTRFPNELNTIKNNKGIIIKVIRDSGNTVGTLHASETALDDYTGWDYIINNNGSIEQLEQEVVKFLEKFNLLLEN
jgi:hypothetical protein